MAHRTLRMPPPTEPCSVLTLMEDLVFAVLATKTPLAKCVSNSTEDVQIRDYLSNWTEAGGHLLDARIRPQPERMELQKLGGFGNKLIDGLMEIASQHVKSISDEQVKVRFQFFAPKAYVEFGDKSRTIIHDLSSISRLKFLTTAIKNEFGPEFRSVAFVVDRNELQMLYHQVSLFKSDVKDAESYIAYAIEACKIHWLQRFQLLLIGKYVPSRSSAEQWRSSWRHACKKKLKVDLLIEHAGAAGADTIERINEVIFLPKHSLTLRDKTCLSAWEEVLIRKLIQVWLEWSTCEHPSLKGSTCNVAFKCSGSSTEKIGESTPELTSYAYNIEHYIRSQLREHKKNGNEPAVTIRISNKPDDRFLISPSSCIIQSTGEAKGSWVSISDADGQDRGRTLICRSSNFYTGLSAFLGTTDIDKFTSLEGYERVVSESIDFQPSTICTVISELPVSSVNCRKRKMEGENTEEIMRKQNGFKNAFIDQTS